ncbi:MAG: type I restriction-modification system subunit M [Candidatus Gracilibacteria bacterium]|nr:type I restriction-modification system subunit M [Candidatus Gracilibacteria bacterium]
MSEAQKQLLEKQLWNIANELRGKMTADEFRDYILGFIFYKYLSEKIELKANKLLLESKINKKYNELHEGKDKEIIDAIKEETIEDLGYFLNPNELFSQVAKKGNNRNENTADNFILDDLQKILKNIESSTMGTESEDDFDDLFSDLDLTSQKLGKTAEQKNELVSKILGHLDKIDFALENTELDVLGDAYEYLIAQFASGAGKKAGEFYTPQQVSQILAKIVTSNKSQIKSVYDPTCGSGSLLLRVAKQVKQVGEFFGQELNRTTYNLARMNMILHDVNYRRFNIRQEDTLEHPQHIDKKFEAIVANPPFGLKWKADNLKMSDDRFSQYGKLAPAGKADFAFIQHMVHHLDENGVMAVVVAHGVLFRGAAEGHIRKFLIEDKNYLDTVIGLPANIFYGTSIPTCILVFKKCRENPDNILFIDASNDFEKGKNQNKLRDSDLDKIINTFKSREEIEKYSHKASLEELKENDYNLNIPRYVDTFEEEVQIDLDAVASRLHEIESESKILDEKIKGFCEELGVRSPV